MTVSCQIRTRVAGRDGGAERGGDGRVEPSLLAAPSQGEHPVNQGQAGTLRRDVAELGRGEFVPRVPLLRRLASRHRQRVGGLLQEGWTIGFVWAKRTDTKTFVLVPFFKLP